MEFERLKKIASTLTGILEQEGIMTLDELRDLTNLKENDVLLALDWLQGEERVEFLPSGKKVSVMLLF